MSGDFQREGPACSNLSSIVQKQPSTANLSRIRLAPTKAANFRNCRTVSSRLRITSRGWRTIMTKQYSLRSRTDLAALSLQARKNTFCGALARPSREFVEQCPHRFDGLCGRQCCDGSQSE